MNREEARAIAQQLAAQGIICAICLEVSYPMNGDDLVTTYVIRHNSGLFAYPETISTPAQAIHLLHPVAITASPAPDAQRVATILKRKKGSRR